MISLYESSFIIIRTLSTASERKSSQNNLSKKYKVWRYIEIQALKWHFYSLFSPLMFGSALASHSDQLSPHAGQNRHWKLPVYPSLELVLLKEKGTNFSRAKNVLLKILIIPDWVTCFYHQPIIQTKTSLDIFILGPCQSPWSSFLIDKGCSVSGK